MPYKNPEDRKAWLLKNKDKNRAKSQKYNEEHAEEQNEKSRLWYESNKEAKAAQNVRYREENKEAIKIYRNEKITCDVCKCEINRSSKSQHNKSKAHLATIQYPHLPRTIINLWVSNLPEKIRNDIKNQYNL
jgi:hypothetical protein